MLIAEYSYEDDIEVQREEARIQGEKSAKIETAKKMIRDKIPEETICKYTNLTLNEIQKIKEDVTIKT